MEKEEIKKEVTEIINKSVEENVAKKATEMKATADEQVKSLQAEIETLKKADAEKTETIKSLGEKLKENEKPVQMTRKARKELYKELKKQPQLFCVQTLSMAMVTLLSTNIHLLNPVFCVCNYLVW